MGSSFHREGAAYLKERFVIFKEEWVHQLAAALYQGAAEQMTYLKLPVAAAYKLAGQIFVSSNIGINRRNKNNQKKNNVSLDLYAFVTYLFSHRK